MKRFLALLLLCALLLSVAPNAVFAEGANLVKNGDFEASDASADGWSTWCNGEAGDMDAEFLADGGVGGSGCVKITNSAPVASNFNQTPALEAGKTYRMTGMIRTEGVSDGGQGACISYTGYDEKTDEWLCETTTQGLYGDNDWTEVSEVFTIPDGCGRTIVNARIYFATGSAWYDDIVFEEIDVAAVVPSTTHELKLTDTPNAHRVNAFGCEWDPKLLYVPSLTKGAVPEDLELIARRADILNIGRVRVMMMVEWYEPKNDNDDPYVADAEAFRLEGQMGRNEMSSLWAYLDVCQRLGIRVTLTWWGAQSDIQNDWLAFEGVTDWVTAPNDLEEMAENISVFLRYATACGYTCIDSVILQNEPYYSFQTAQGVVDFDYYVEYYKTVRARLDRDGLGDIALIGSDDSNDFSWYSRSVESLTGVVTGFNSHSYLYAAGDYTVGAKIRGYISRRTGLTDLSFFLGEFGDGTTVGAYSTLSVDTYERGLFVGVSAINSLKAGSTGSLYWPLHDVYYYLGPENDGSNGGLMKMGLFAFASEGWRIRPTYHAWGLVCNHALPGSEVFDVTGEDDYVEAVATRAESGHWSILAANRANTVQTLAVDAAAIGAPLELTVFTADAVTEEEALIAPSATVTPEDGVYTFELPAMSFAVLSNLDDADRAAASVLPTPERAITTEPGAASGGTVTGDWLDVTDAPRSAPAADLAWLWWTLGGMAVAAVLVAALLLRARRRTAVPKADAKPGEPTDMTK